MPTIINGYLTRGRRNYTPAEVLSRAGYIAHNPRVLTIRDVAWAIYLVYVAYVTYFTLRFIGRLLFSEESESWCPRSIKTGLEWHREGNLDDGEPHCMKILRWSIYARLEALAYGIFAWGFIGAVGTFVLEEVVRWIRRR